MRQFANSGRELADWHRRMPGSIVLDTENDLLAPLVHDVFGYHLLIVGPRDYLPALGAARVHHCTWLTPPAPDEPAPDETTPDPEAAPPAARCSPVRGRACEMPVSSDSIDIVILVHVIEFEKDPYAVLRETERVLVPEGHVIVAGYNALGPMGAWSLVHRRRAPWTGRFHTAARVKDWLSVLGFDTVARDGCFFRPPLPNARVLRRLQGLERLGRRFWPGLCGTWFLVARKRTATPTLLRPGWRRRRRRAPIREAGLAGSAMTRRGRLPADHAA